MNNYFKEEEEIEQVILDNEIKINFLDNKDDIKIKKVRVWKLTKNYHFLDKDRVVF